MIIVTELPSLKQQALPYSYNRHEDFTQLRSELSQLIMGLSKYVCIQPFSTPSIYRQCLYSVYKVKHLASYTAFVKHIDREKNIHTNLIAVAKILSL